MLITDTRIFCTHGKFDLISERIFHSHIDIVVPISKAFSYCLTVANRYLRWPEVIAIVDILAETIIMALYSGCVGHCGISVTVTTARESKFESSTFRMLHTSLSLNDIGHKYQKPRNWTMGLDLTIICIRLPFSNSRRRQKHSIVHGFWSSNLNRFCRAK